MLIFFPIAGNYPVIVTNDTITFSNIFPVRICCVTNAIFENNTVFYPNLDVTLNVAIGKSVSLITTDNGSNATWTAQELFNQDNSTIPRPTPKPTITIPNQTSDPIPWFNDSWIVKTIGSVLTIVLFAGLVITTSAVILSRRVREETKKLLRMDKQPKDSSKDKKKGH